MFCKKCGTSIEEGGKFCPNCGEPVSSVDAAKVSNTPNRPDSGAQNQAIPPITYRPDGNNTTQEDKKNHKNWPIFVGVAAAAVVVIAVVFLNFPRINNFAHKTFSSPEKYYQYVEKKAVKDMAGNVAECYDTMILDSLNFYDKSVEGELKVEFDEEGREMLGLLGLAGIDVSWIENVSVRGVSSIKGDTVSMEGGLNLNDTDVITGQVVLDTETECLYAQLPELNKKYLGINAGVDEDFEEIFEMLPQMQQSNKESIEAMPGRRDMEKLINRYALLALSCVDDVSKEKDVLSVDGVSQKCTKLKVTIDMETFCDMMETVLEEMKDDKDIKKIIIESARANNENTKMLLGESADAEEVYELFQEGIEDLLDELDYMKDYEADEKIVMQVYVDGKGQIKGRTVKFGDMKINVLAPKKGSRIGYELSVKEAGESIELSGMGKKSGDTVTGDFDLKYNGTALINITTKKLNVEDMKKGLLNGQITVRASSTIGRVLGSVSGLSILEDISMTMDFSSSEKQYSCKARIDYDDKAMASISAFVKSGKGTAASVPGKGSVVMIGDYEDTDALEEWLEELDLNKLVSNLDKAGVPDEYTDELEEIADSMDDPDDFLDYMYYYY